MPWSVGSEVKGKGFPIVKDTTGEVVGYSKTKKMAESAVAARYANMRNPDRKGMAKKNMNRKMLGKATHSKKMM